MIINQIASGGGGGSTPEKGFLPTAWDDNGFVTQGSVYGLTAIPNYFFYNTSASNGFFKSLTDLDVPSNLTTIGQFSFNRCGNLSAIQLPSGLVTIDNYAFYYCNAMALTSIPSGVTTIGWAAFYACTAITTLSIPGYPTIGGTSTGTSSFSGCTGLTSVTIGGPGKPMTTAKLPAYAFYGCSNLTDITVYTTGAASLATAPFGATNATVTYLAA